MKIIKKIFFGLFILALVISTVSMLSRAIRNKPKKIALKEQHKIESNQWTQEELLKMAGYKNLMDLWVEVGHKPEEIEMLCRGYKKDGSYFEDICDFEKTMKLFGINKETCIAER